MYLAASAFLLPRWKINCYMVTTALLYLKKHTAFWTVILNRIFPLQIAFAFGFISNAVQSMMSAVEFLPQNSAWPICLIVGTKGQFRPVYILSLLIVKWSLFRSRYTCNLVWPSTIWTKKKGYKQESSHCIMFNDIRQIFEVLLVLSYSILKFSMTLSCCWLHWQMLNLTCRTVKV